jgi:hypothetical protein
MRKTQKIKEPGERLWQTKIYPHPEDDSVILVQGTSYFYYYS